MIEWSVFISVAVIHAVAVISPGPDFAVVLKQGFQKGLRSSLLCSVGIGLGILLHVAYSLLGISVVIKTTPWLLNTLIFCAVVYFVYLGLLGVSAKASSAKPILSDAESVKIQYEPWYKSLVIGFLTNGLNPKATLFFLALFTAVIPSDMAMKAKIFIGVYLAIATSVWFCFLSLTINARMIRNLYNKHAVWFDRIMGSVLIILAVMLFFSYV